jgi:hypothetical protein
MTNYRFTSTALGELTLATVHYEQEENGLGATLPG